MSTIRAALATFSLSDHLAHTWENELVTFPIVDLPAGPLAIVDETGVLRPCQISAGRVSFVVDRLPALGSREFMLVARETPTSPVVVKESAGVVELSNGLISLRLPASQAASPTLPGPLLGVRRGDGPWIGGGRIHFSSHLVPEAMETCEVESGALWTTWQVAYRCAGGERYTLTVRLYADKPVAEFTEESSLCRKSCWEFSVRDGLQPDHYWVHPIY
ncbi:MAG TPA: hypothetical protein VGM23_13080, partial [Armatimonadota bacterium]